MILPPPPTITIKAHAIPAGAYYRGEGGGGGGGGEEDPVTSSTLPPPSSPTTPSLDEETKCLRLRKPPSQPSSQRGGRGPRAEESLISQKPHLREAPDCCQPLPPPSYHTGTSLHARTPYRTGMCTTHTDGNISLRVRWVKPVGGLCR